MRPEEVRIFQFFLLSGSTTIPSIPGLGLVVVSVSVVVVGEEEAAEDCLEEEGRYSAKRPGLMSSVETTAQRPVVGNGDRRRR